MYFIYIQAFINPVYLFCHTHACKLTHTYVHPIQYLMSSNILPWKEAFFISMGRCPCIQHVMYTAFIFPSPLSTKHPHALRTPALFQDVDFSDEKMCFYSSCGEGIWQQKVKDLERNPVFLQKCFRVQLRLRAKGSEVWSFTFLLMQKFFFASFSQLCIIEQSNGRTGGWFQTMNWHFSAELSTYTMMSRK